MTQRCVNGNCLEPLTVEEAHSGITCRECRFGSKFSLNLQMGYILHFLNWSSNTINNPLVTIDEEKDVEISFKCDEANLLVSYFPHSRTYSIEIIFAKRIIFCRQQKAITWKTVQKVMEDHSNILEYNEVDPENLETLT